MRLLGCLVTLVLTTPVVASCSADGDCTGTDLVAANSNQVDLSADNQSTVLRGRLSADGDGLAGQPISLALRAEDGTTVFAADLRSTTDGRIVYDLKGRLDATATKALPTVTRFDLDFDGDETYCSSSDAGDLVTVDSDDDADS